MSNESQTAGTSATDPGSAAPASAPAAPAPASAPAASPAAAPAAAPAAPGSMLSTGAAPAAPAPAPAANAPALGADGKPAGEGGKPTGAPEKYEFTMPEGLQADAEVLGKFEAFAKEKNLSQEDAQKFADMGAEVAQKTRDTFVKQIEDVQAKWVSDSRADKEFGGDKLNENLALAKRAREAFGSPELTQMLNESGLGNHPEIIRAFFRVGQAIGEDRLVPGGKAPATGDPLAKMYPSMVKS